MVWKNLNPLILDICYDLGGENILSSHSPPTFSQIVSLMNFWNIIHSNACGKPNQWLLLNKLRGNILCFRYFCHIAIEVWQYAENGEMKLRALATTLKKFFLDLCLRRKKQCATGWGNTFFCQIIVKNLAKLICNDGNDKVGSVSPTITHCWWQHKGL